MSTAPANQTPNAPAPLIRYNFLEEDRKKDRYRWLIFIPAMGVSAIFHGLLFAVMFFLVSGPPNATKNEISMEEIDELKKKVEDSKMESEPPPKEENNVEEEEPIPEMKEDPLTVTDIDPEALEPGQEINYDVDRKADVSVPGLVNPDEPVVVFNGMENVQPSSIAAPKGFGGPGQGEGGFQLPGINATEGENLGGYGMFGSKIKPGSFFGRSGATRERALIEGGGTKATEAAVAAGTAWLIRVQSLDGGWRINGPFPNAGSRTGRESEIAGTALGLLPFLGAEHTHRPKKVNPNDKPIDRSLKFLVSRQDPRTGYFGGRMYAHALATIAICEDYGLTQDPYYARPAQMAVNYLVSAQHSEGGWRYGPNQKGDTSVTGWCVMALKSAKMAGLRVPDITFKKAVHFLDSVCDPKNEGYGYTSKGSRPTMTAVGLLCRQYLQGWGHKNLRMIKGISNLKRYPPGKMRNMYYYYYATQVMHHFGHEDWKAWNEVMRADLVKRQDKSKDPRVSGSWSPVGDRHAGAGGRLMETSLCLLTLEVYYRYLPLYYREAGERQQKLLGGT